jgi:CheY-like chemotaxis protein
VLVTALRMDGHEVLEATNGRQAVTVLNERLGRIDLLITDLMMPEMDGLAILRHVRNTPALDTIDTIVCSANPTSDPAIQAGRGRIAERLLKPVELQELRAAVNRVAVARGSLGRAPAS